MIQVEGNVLELVDEPVREVLTCLHRLLIAHRYDLAQGEHLEVLRQVTPGAEVYYESGDEALRPVAISVAQVLLDLAAAEVQEALVLGYAAGQCRLDTRPREAEYRALNLIGQMRCEALMATNVGHGYVLTEAATAALRATVAA